MSRTDKDAPHWVRAEFYKPDHDWRCPDLIPRSWWGVELCDRCTLPEEPVRADIPRRLRSKVGPAQCVWRPEGWDRRYYTWPPRRYDRKIYLYGPSRCRVRAFRAEALQAYRGCGDVIDLIEPDPRRRSGLDYWD